MNWERIKAAATPMDLAPRSETHRSSGAEAATLVATLAAYALHVWLATPARVPEVVLQMPPPTAYEDCLTQNYDAPRLLVRCEDLAP